MPIEGDCTGKQTPAPINKGNFPLSLGPLSLIQDIKRGAEGKLKGVGRAVSLEQRCSTVPPPAVPCRTGGRQGRASGDAARAGRPDARGPGPPHAAKAGGRCAPAGLPPGTRGREGPAAGLGHEKVSSWAGAAVAAGTGPSRGRRPLRWRGGRPVDGAQENLQRPRPPPRGNARSRPRRPQSPGRSASSPRPGPPSSNPASALSSNPPGDSGPRPRRRAAPRHPGPRP